MLDQFLAHKPVSHVHTDRQYIKHFSHLSVFSFEEALMSSQLQFSFKQPFFSEVIVGQVDNFFRKKVAFWEFFEQKKQ